MKAEHSYALTVRWTGNTGSGTSSYRSYERSHSIHIEGKPDIEGSSDPSFRGDKTRHNPEEMLLSALSTCHMLSYLHLCAVNGVVVNHYIDQATATMAETPNGGGHFTGAILHPVVTVADASMIEKANELHKKASELCFIASSVNFPVRHEPVAMVGENFGSPPPGI
ncbi:Organic hydroperoxide reductase OsmC/OhrA [Dyadobacter sp. SG02]|uniref:OsmC family protein n=1 Tax=Dyadobacter sp. SG02 TaxID=1855291 RepID=UPI0008C233E8|nr:OsmC family protein [Dyadobacter sp. SG02]SEJ36924.1 Organic hydroperoxide reductase OsmC/OhrA [Dyadobacter sp. SG02]